MYKKILFFFLIAILHLNSSAEFLNNSSSNISEVKEIQTIEEYSKQFLDENFILEDLKKEQEEEAEEKLAEKLEKNLDKDKNMLRELAIDEEGNVPDVEIEENKNDSNYVKQEESTLENIREIENFNKKEDTSEGLFPIEIVSIEATNKKILKNTNKKVISAELESKLKAVKDIKKQITEAPSVIIKKKKPKKVFKKTEKKVEWKLEDNFRACLIGDLKGNVYFSKNPDKPYPLASVTKVMTLLVTFDAIHAKKISLNSKVRISRNAARQGGSKVSLKAGQIYRLEDLIKASAIYSANNATYAIAEFVGKGSLKRFVKLMNNKVRRLGLQKDLKYYTPAGLPSRMTKEPMDVGTARAIYKLSIEALKYKRYIQIAGIKKTTIRGGRIKLRNRNHLLGKKGVYGLKTGYHKEAKYNITVASKIKGKDIIVVVLGGKTYKTRDKTALDILNIFENNYYTIIKKK